MTEYRLIERLPTVTEYRDLRRLCGLSEKTEEAAGRGLPASLFAVVIETGGAAIGMGRVVGDNGTAYQLVDIAVLPAHRARAWASGSLRPSSAGFTPMRPNPPMSASSPTGRPRTFTPNMASSR